MEADKHRKQAEKARLFLFHMGAFKNEEINSIYMHLIPYSFDNSLRRQRNVAKCFNAENFC